MYRGLFLAVVFLAAASADPADDMKKCMRIFNPKSQHCCKADRPLKPHHDHDDMKECMQLQGNPPSCEREICMAVKHGVATSDGKIDKEGFQTMVDREFSDNPELSKLLMDNCADGDLSKYGEPDMCELLKLKMCMEVQLVASCPEWDNGGECAGMKELVTECVEKLS